MAFADDRTGPLAVADLVSWLWRNKVAILAGGLICAAIGLGYALLATPTYKATVTLLPQAEDANLGLMNQIEMISGFNLDGGGANEELYGKIIASTTLLDGLLARRWDHADHAEPADLYAVFDVDPDEAEARHRLHRVLRNEVIRFSRDRQTGYMEVSATAPSDPGFAAALANTVVEDLDRFNKTTQKARATEHRVFVESREADAQEKLRQAEDALAVFVNENRSYSDSPLLLVEYNRLSRLVTAQSTVWMELRRQTELARIDENKDMRSVTILSPADPPVRPVSPRLVFDVVAGFCLGCLAVVLLLAVRGQDRTVRP